MSSAMPTGMGMDSSSMMSSMDSSSAMVSSMMSSMMTSASSMMMSSPMSTGSPTSMMMSSGTAMAASSATSMNMSGMSMGGMSDGTCQINMLWNWYTIDACFLAEGWQIQTNAQFAGTCIGVILITMMLPLLRKIHAAYDGYVARDAAARIARYAASGAGPVEAQALQAQSSDSETDAKTGGIVSVRGLGARMSAFQAAGGMNRTPGKARPLVWQQALRALLHAVQFGVAYLVMLLAMYYNGYILISIFIGAFLGFFVFEYEITCKTMSPGQSEDEVHDVTTVTGCCG